jgi:hypothetical protein
MLSCCSTSDAPPEPDVEAVSAEAVEDAPAESAELRQAMAGEVDYDSYFAGFQRYSDCLAAEGHGLIVHDAGGSIVDYGVPEAAVSSGADEYCYTREFAPLDSAWQIANEESSEWAELLRACLQERGVVPAATLAEMEDQRERAGVGPEECLLG